MLAALDFAAGISDPAYLPEGAVEGLRAIVEGADPTAPDPVPALVDEYFRLVAVVNAAESEALIGEAFAKGTAVVQRAVDAVPSTVAGILAQLRLLREVKDFGDEWSDDRDVRLLNAIEAGVRRLGDAS